MEYRYVNLIDGDTATMLLYGDIGNEIDGIFFDGVTIHNA